MHLGSNPVASEGGGGERVVVVVGVHDDFSHPSSYSDSNSNSALVEGNTRR